MFQEDEEKKGPVWPQINRRVETHKFPDYQLATEYKNLRLSTGDYSKVKTIARSNGTYDVALYVPLKGAP